MVGTILSMLGPQLDDATLADIIAEVDEDGSGQIEFEAAVSYVLQRHYLTTTCTMSTSFIEHTNQNRIDLHNRLLDD